MKKKEVDTPIGTYDCDGVEHEVTFKFCFDGRKSESERELAAQAEAKRNYKCANDDCIHNVRIDSVTATGNVCQLPGDDLNGREYQVKAAVFCHPS